MLISLDSLKLELGITTTDLDKDLLSVIRRVSAVVRERTFRYLHCRIHSASSTGTLLTVESVGHGLQTGNTVVIAGCNAVPTLNGTFVVTVLSSDKFTAVDPSGQATTDAGSSGVVHPQVVSSFQGNDQPLIWIPETICPLKTLSKVEVRTSAEEWEELTVATDYFTPVIEPCAKVMSLELVSGTWASWKSYSRARSSTSRQPAVRVTVNVGMPSLPGDLEEAALSMGSELMESQGLSRGVQQESYGGVSRSRLSGLERAESLLSPQRIIDAWRVRHY